MRVYNFGGSGRNLTKFYQQMWIIAGMIKWTLILQGVPPTKFGRVKNVQNSARFSQLSSLIGNISGMNRRIKNPKSSWSTTFHPLLCEKKFCELWATNNKVKDAHVDPPNWTFSEYQISAPSLHWPLKFLHALDTGQGLLAHTINWVGGPPKKFSGRIFKIGLKIPHMRAHNFRGSGRNLTTSYHMMWLIAGVITCTLILQAVHPTKFGRVKTS